MTFTELKNRVMELCIKFNYVDLLHDLQYMNEAQWLSAYFMLERLHGG